jgi:UPF0755 protein
MLFGPEDEDDPRGYEPIGRAARRRERRQGRKHRRNGRLMVLLALVIVVVAAVVLVPWIKRQFEVKDYSGTGSGSVQVVVKPNASATDIGHTLVKDGVVASVQAFVNAASHNAKSANIQPGTYTVHKHMSGANAVVALLNANNRSSEKKFVITEGETSLDVQAALVKALGSGKASGIAAAMKKIKDLPLPTNYRTASGTPTSLEGFLFPATYPVTPGESASSALSQMIDAFIQQDRSSGFTEAANKLNLSPYQALIVASLVQSEAKFPADMAKVARVIMNRLSAGKPLQVDATTLYGAKVAGQDPSKVPNVATYDTPYNTYLHAGLPPTPISNPGAVAMHAAVHPTKGDWLFYVNKDAAGDLFFTNSERAFERAALRCRTNHWGCGG